MYIKKSVKGKLRISKKLGLPKAATLIFRGKMLTCLDHEAQQAIVGILKAV